jgi:hypothetical protein
MSTPEEMEQYFAIILDVNDDDLMLALFQQGLDTLESFNSLTVEDITRICATVRRPGGMIVDEFGDLIPDRGQQVSAVLEKRLKQFWFYVRYAYMTQRVPDFVMGDGVPELADLSNLNSFIKSFPEPKDVEKPPQFPGLANARKWFEQFDSWAAKYLGPSGVPLSYVIRASHGIALVDPGWYEPSLREDIAFRGPHGAANIFWREDNTAVWDMLAHCLHPVKEYVHIKQYEKKADGHAAYHAFKKIMLGPAITKSLEATADKLIRTTKYSGAKGFTFDRMVTMMTQGFIDCGTEYSEDKKVGMLLDAITDSSLEATKLAVLASEKLENDFQAAVGYIQQQIAKRGDPNSKGTRGVAAYGSGGRGNQGRGRNGKGRGGGRQRRRTWKPAGSGRPLEKWDPTKPGAWYSFKAFRKFTPEQKAKNREAKGRSGNNTTITPSPNAQIAALSQQIATLTSNLESAQAVNEHQSIGAAISGKRKRDS